jgi:hypothetical protein
MSEWYVLSTARLQSMRLRKNSLLPDQDENPSEVFKRASTVTPTNNELLSPYFLGRGRRASDAWHLQVPPATSVSEQLCLPDQHRRR